ncbi:MFS transporter [Aquabacterium sp. A7-Y]|uniref:MFS transporter n=1 Tax=Aquabacterium sp. A7-Y TaxID=1349605 RepID=UPI00223DEF50|nr:MFS transporter [Aquabacterium sp. A7-Y]MCW7536871.1 MFS transporter [Aquabacterium sp. A7-Y]
MPLRPDEHVTPADVERGQHDLVKDSAWGSLAGSLHGGVILVGFALALGARPVHVGLLAAIPLFAQAVQLPAIALVERLGQRRKIAVLCLTAARALVLLLASLPFLSDAPTQLSLLIAAHIVISALGSVCACALNSWLHQLLPQEGLGAFFARRLFWGTAVACVGTLAAGLFVDHAPFDNKIYAYSVCLVAGALTGFISCRYLARVPEHKMPDVWAHGSVWSRLKLPFGDTNFRNFLVFMAGWNLASSFAAPFLTVFLMEQLGYPLGTITTLWVVSQLANALTLYAWGRISDRLTNKGILSVALPAWFACMLALAFVAEPARHAFTLPLLYLLHIVMGAAAGGIGLANGNIGLKLAPQGQATAYLAAVSLTGAVFGGVAPLLAGAMAQWLENARIKLALVLEWAGSSRMNEWAVISFTHWEFLFALSALAGLYVLHRLSKVSEGKEVSERVVVQQFALEAVRTVNQLSSVGGMLGSLFTFGRLFDRRLYLRPVPRAGGGK